MASPYFPPLVIGGETKEFLHLEPFNFEFYSKSAKKNLRVHVTFRSHAFSKKYIAADHPDGDPIIDSNTPRPRTFCPIRYRLSFALPNLILGLNNEKVKVWETAARRNWAYSIKIEDPAGPYHIFFEVRRPAQHSQVKQDISLIVESAYHENAESGPPNLLGSISFMLLCSNVYMKKPTSTKR